MKLKVFFLTIFFLSCKNQPLKQFTLQDLPVKYNIEIIINGIVPINDQFELFYFEPPKTEFNQHDAIQKNVVGSKNPQSIKFMLPHKIIPDRIRIDLGKKTEQQFIKIDNITIKYGQKKFIFEDEILLQNFSTSKYLKYNAQDKSYSSIKIEGRFDPYLYSTNISGVLNYLLED